MANITGPLRSSEKYIARNVCHAWHSCAHLVPNSFPLALKTAHVQLVYDRHVKLRNLLRPSNPKPRNLLRWLQVEHVSDDDADCDESEDESEEEEEADEPLRGQKLDALEV